jgi:hypothetical protein
MALLTDRSAAKSAGHVKYQGRPCNNSNHNGVRYTLCNRCCQCRHGYAVKAWEKEKKTSHVTRNTEQKPQAHKLNTMWKVPKV